MLQNGFPLSREWRSLGFWDVGRGLRTPPTHVPCYFKNKLDELNVIIGQYQLDAMDLAVSLFKNKNKYDKIETIKKNNIVKSVAWCEKYKIPYNKFTEKTNMFLQNKDA